MASMVWVRGTRVYRDDLAAEIETRKFLNQCRQEGRITAEEFTALTRPGGNAGRSEPWAPARYDDFVQMVCANIGWPEDDVRRCLALHLRQGLLTPAHIEVYLNYPARTQEELAAMLGVERYVIYQMLKRVRQVWPAILHLDAAEDHGVPRLEDMESLWAVDSIGEEYDRLNDAEVVPVCGGFSNDCEGGEQC